MLLGLDLKQWLGFTVAAAVISTIGALIGITLKDYFFSRALETWKQRRTLEQVYQRFRDPLLLSARELCSRVIEILNDYPTVYLHQTVVDSRPEQQIANSIHDAYFQRYKLVSTTYRFCAFLGWLELYRQEIVFLHSGNNRHARRLENCTAAIRADFADGQLNTDKNWLQWRDTLVFREELRAIGESMIETRGNSRTIMGYGKFSELFDAVTPLASGRWVSVMLNFLLELEPTKLDFRKRRLERLVVHLTNLLRELDSSPPEDYVLAAHDKYVAVLAEEPSRA